MSRWMIEKAGTGIEKSGSGIEKSGTGIERSGTGIERSGTGIDSSFWTIEKAGTGIRRAVLALSLSAIAFMANVQAASVSPAGTLQVVVQDNTIAVSWVIGNSIFSGISSLNGSFANMALTEIAVRRVRSEVAIAGAGTGVQVAGAGTGVQVAGAGTGVQVAGAGTGVQVAGAGTGTEIAGAGTGSNPITITLPQGTGMAMEVSLACGYASVSVVDSDSIEIVSFENVRVIGSDDCGDGFGSAFKSDPGSDFRAD